MAYGGQFLSLTWLFTLVGTDEVAATSINYTTAPGWTGAVVALGEVGGAVGIGPALYDPMEDLMSLTQTGWADYSQMEGWKLAAIGTDGHYLTDPVTFEPGSKAIGTVLGVVPQSSCVVSLNSGLITGGGNRGRMYLPHTRGRMESTTPHIAAADAAAIVAQAKTTVNALTTAINAAATATLFPAILSTLGSTKGVTELRVGNINDTQRRRRNRLVETYSVETLA